MTAPWHVEFLKAIDVGEPIYRRCGACDAVGWPPRRSCPECGEPEMVDAPLSTRASVVSHTEITATIPKFSGETPYTVLIAEFEEGVRLTGQLRGEETIDRGDDVELGVERRDEDDWIVTFTPA